MVDAPMRKEMEDALKLGTGPKVARFALACLGGIPFAGEVFGAGAGASSDAEQDRMKRIFSQWLNLQEEELRETGKTLFEVMIRIDQTNETIQYGIESQDYLSLIKKCYRGLSIAASSIPRRAHRYDLWVCLSATFAWFRRKMNDSRYQCIL